MSHYDNLPEYSTPSYLSREEILYSLLLEYLTPPEIDTRIRELLLNVKSNLINTRTDIIPPFNP